MLPQISKTSAFDSKQNGIAFECFVREIPKFLRWTKMG
jgi:hypothetical protein